MTLNIWESEFKPEQDAVPQEGYEHTNTAESEKSPIDKQLLSRLPDYFAMLLEWRIELEQNE